jgi:hypothetical protein
MWRRGTILAILTLSMGGSTSASWLSDITGINIDLQRSIGVPTKIVTEQVAGPTNPVPIATAAQRAKLDDQLTRSVKEFKLGADQWERYSTILAVGTIVLALMGAIAGFLQKAILAGVLSLIVTAGSGASRVLPLKERATYYRALYGQSLSIQVDTELRDQLTVAEYNQRVDQLTALLLYASKLPQIGDTTPITDELIKDIRMKVSAKS